MLDNVFVRESFSSAKDIFAETFDRILLCLEIFSSTAQYCLVDLKKTYSIYVRFILIELWYPFEL